MGWRIFVCMCIAVNDMMDGWMDIRSFFPPLEP